MLGSRQSPWVLPVLMIASMAMAACSPARWQETRGGTKPAPGPVVPAQQTVTKPTATPTPAPTASPTAEPDPVAPAPRPTTKGKPPVVPTKFEIDDSRPLPPPPPVVTKPAPKPKPIPPPVISKPKPKPVVKPAPVEPPPPPVIAKPEPKKPIVIKRKPRKRLVTKGKFNADRFFVVENVATGAMRVYERCTSAPDCAHQLIMQTDMVVGEDTKDGAKRTWLGNYRITQWFKFYEDQNRQHPSFFNPVYPQLPAPGADLRTWISKKLLPHGQGRTRGAFGWYTAHVGPNANEQWTHGTWGHGKDGAKFIEEIIVGPGKHDPRVASKGCVRVENQAIALMHTILPVGTRIFRVYAKEAYRNRPELPRKKLTAIWKWALTSEGVMTDGPSADLDLVTARNVPREQILEDGTYTMKQSPLAIPIEHANNYGVDPKGMRGYFLVDEGRFIDYAHPSGLAIGGLREPLPDALVTVNPKIAIPKESKRDKGRPAPVVGQTQPEPVIAPPAIPAPRVKPIVIVKPAPAPPPVPVIVVKPAPKEKPAPNPVVKPKPSVVKPEVKKDPKIKDGDVVGAPVPPPPNTPATKGKPQPPQVKRQIPPRKIVPGIGEFPPEIPQWPPPGQPQERAATVEPPAPAAAATQATAEQPQN